MKKNFFKSLIVVTIIGLVYFSSNNLININEKLQNNLNMGTRSLKVVDERIKINEDKLNIIGVMPEIVYKNKNVERYINTYLRKNINEFINEQRQVHELENKNEKVRLTFSYDVAFNSKKVLNIVVDKGIKYSNNRYEYFKDSYVFDLITGQRIYIDNLLKENEDYKETILTYISKKIKDKNKVNSVDKYTTYTLSEDGINLFFNPYKSSNSKIVNEVKIPYSIFKNEIKVIESSDIVANIDTQTIITNNKYINSIINIPIITTANKEVEKNLNNIIRKDIMNDYNQFNEETKVYFKDIIDVDRKFVANTDFEVKKNSNNVLSLLVKYYKFSGGAHGVSENVSYNIDIINGKILSLSDLFEPNTNYKEVINKEIRSQLEKLAKDNPENAYGEEFKSIKENQKFYIQDNKLVIYFDLYEIAPYAAGIPEFPININKINHIIKPEYLEMFR